MASFPLDRVFMRSILVRDKQFLFSLFQNKGNVLQTARSYQMNTVIRVLHLILNDEIELYEEQFKLLKASKRYKMLKTHFERKPNFLNSLRQTDEEKRKLLKQFTACYPYLFNSIFVN